MKNVPAASAVDMTKFRRLELGLCLAMMRETAKIRHRQSGITKQHTLNRTIVRSNGRHDAGIHAV